jgi:hypothetical protein
MRKLMAKIILLFILLCSRLVSSAQQHEVAMAEQAFAQMGIDSGVKKAFIHFLDSNSILLHEGKSHAGLPHWKSVPESKFLLFWKPVYTGMAASGDIGFSTGPFEQKAFAADEVRGSGNYNSIWVKNKQGQWKVLIDMGVPYKPSLFQKEWKPVIYTGQVAGANTNWEKAEHDLITRHRQQGNQAFLQHITSNSWFNIQGLQPLHTVKDIEAGLRQIPADLQFEYMGGALSAAGDLFYAYGAVIRNGKKDNYLRVWGYEKDGWKLLLQVLKWAH